MRNIIYKDEYIKLDSGYLFGRGVFETILIKEKPIFLKEHIERLNRGIEYLGLGDKIEEKFVLDKIKYYNIKNKALKIIVSEKNLVLEEREVTYKEEDYKIGFSLKLSKVIRSSNSDILKIKSINYLENIIEREKALKEGYNEVVFFNEKGFLSEGSISNIFIVKNKNIYTPHENSGLLNGTVRNFLINNYDIKETNISLEDILNCDEVFITNSLMGIMKVSIFEGKTYKESNITEWIRKEYEDKIWRI